MKHLHRWFYGILFLVSMTACQKTKISAQELEEYIVSVENGLSQTSLENNIKVQAIFRPADLLVFQEVKNRTDLTISNIQEVRNRYKRNIYITVNISQDGQDPLYRSGDQGSYSEALKKMAFRMSEQAILITANKDTIQAADYIFSPMYNMSGAVSVMFVFKDANTITSEWIDFELKDPGWSTGDRKFRFERKDIENTPEVEMEVRRNL